MTKHQSEKHPTSTLLIAAEPQIYASDLAASLDFYCTRLGFETVFSYGEPPYYAQVGRDGVRINLRKVKAVPMNAAFHHAEADALALTITVDDAKPLFLEYEEKAVPFHQRLRTEPWGSRTFIVKDPDGNLIAFAGKGEDT